MRMGDEGGLRGWAIKRWVMRGGDERGLRRDML